MRDRFEYVVLSIDSTDTTFNLRGFEASLQDFGMQGFRVVGVVPGVPEKHPSIVILSKMLDRPQDRIYTPRRERFRDDRG